MSEIINNESAEIISTENTSGVQATASYAEISASPTSLSFTKSASSKTVTVTCSDTSWVVGGGSTWCTITKTSNTKATVTVTANSGSKRTMAVVCVNGPNVATISITQAAGTVTYDRSSMITVYQQITNSSCAATCAAMCVNKSPATLQNDGFDLGYAMWGNIASTYGYTTDGVITGTISNVFSVLKSGYPVIAQVNDGNSDGRSQHWVVVTKYVGDGTDMSASNFTCADPWTGDVVTLSDATCFYEIKRYVVFKKQ